MKNTPEAIALYELMQLFFKNDTNLVAKASLENAIREASIETLLSHGHKDFRHTAAVIKFNHSSRMAGYVFLLLVNKCLSFNNALLAEKLLFKTKHNSLNMLHHSLRSGHDLFSVVLLNAAREALQQKLLKKKHFHNFILATNAENRSTVHEAALGNSANNMISLIQALQFALSEKIISLEEYKNILISKSEAGYSPFHVMGNKNNPELVKFYLKTLKETFLIHNPASVASPLEDQTDYTSVLVSPTNFGLTPLFLILESGSLEQYFAYMEAVDEAHRADYLDVNDYRSLLTPCLSDGTTPLHKAALSGNLQLVRSFVALLELKLDSKALTEQFHGKSLKCGLPHTVGTDSDAVAINELLTEMRQKYSMEYIVNGNSLQMYRLTKNKVFKPALVPVTTTKKLISKKQMVQ